MEQTETQSRALPGSWVDRIFNRMQGLYGSLWVDRWRTGKTVRVGGHDVDSGLLNAKAVWADELAGFANRPDCIKAALEACRSMKLPPTLPEFANACRDAMRRLGDGTKKIAYAQTEEEREQQRESAELVANAVRSKISGFDCMHWATHPRSKIAVGVICTESQAGNKALCGVFDDLVAAGVVTAEGKALKVWGNGEWVKS